MAAEGEPTKRARRPPRVTPMWLAHHYPEDYDRCVVIGRSHVCRRCIVLYPLAFVVMFATLSWHPETALDVAVLAALPVPALIELSLEQLAVLAYNPRRQIIVTVPLALGLGRGFAIYLDDQTSRLFWGVVVSYTAIAVLMVFLGRRRLPD